MPGTRARSASTTLLRPMTSSSSGRPERRGGAWPTVAAGCGAGAVVVVAGARRGRPGAARRGRAASPRAGSGPCRTACGGRGHRCPCVLRASGEPPSLAAGGVLDVHPGLGELDADARPRWRSPSPPGPSSRARARWRRRCPARAGGPPPGSGHWETGSRPRTASIRRTTPTQGAALGTRAPCCRRTRRRTPPPARGGRPGRRPSPRRTRPRPRPAPSRLGQRLDAAAERLQPLVGRRRLPQRSRRCTPAPTGSARRRGSSAGPAAARDPGPRRRGRSCRATWTSSRRWWSAARRASSATAISAAAAAPSSPSGRRTS